MTKRAEFNADEWSTVTEGPMLAGMRVVTAARGGTIRETLAMGKAYTQARQEQGKSELLDDLVSAPPTVDPSRLQGANDLNALTTQRLREALGLVQQKASPEELEAYKAFVRAVAQAAASAHKEGGMMGIGGQEVSEGEQAALDEIAGILDAG